VVGSTAAVIVSVNPETGFTSGAFDVVVLVKNYPTQHPPTIRFLDYNTALTLQDRVVTSGGLSQFTVTVPQLPERVAGLSQIILTTRTPMFDFGRKSLESSFEWIAPPQPEISTISPLSVPISDSATTISARTITAIVINLRQPQPPSTSILVMEVAGREASEVQSQDIGGQLRVTGVLNTIGLTAGDQELKIHWRSSAAPPAISTVSLYSPNLARVIFTSQNKAYQTRPTLITVRLSMLQSPDGILPTNSQDLQVTFTVGNTSRASSSVMGQIVAGTLAIDEENNVQVDVFTPTMSAEGKGTGTIEFKGSGSRASFDINFVALPTGSATVTANPRSAAAQPQEPTVATITLSNFIAVNSIEDLTVEFADASSAAVGPSLQCDLASLINCWSVLDLDKNPQDINEMKVTVEAPFLYESQHYNTPLRVNIFPTKNGKAAGGTFRFTFKGRTASVLNINPISGFASGNEKITIKVQHFEHVDHVFFGNILGRNLDQQAVGTPDQYERRLEVMTPNLPPGNVVVRIEGWLNAVEMSASYDTFEVLPLPSDPVDIDNIKVTPSRKVRPEGGYIQVRIGGSQFRKLNDQSEITVKFKGTVDLSTTIEEFRSFATFTELGFTLPPGTAGTYDVEIYPTSVESNKGSFTVKYENPPTEIQLPTEPRQLKGGETAFVTVMYPPTRASLRVSLGESGQLFPDTYEEINSNLARIGFTVPELTCQGQVSSCEKTLQIKQFSNVKSSTNVVYHERGSNTPVLEEILPSQADQCGGTELTALISKVATYDVSVKVDSKDADIVSIVPDDTTSETRVFFTNPVVSRTGDVPVSIRVAGLLLNYTIHIVSPPTPVIQWIYPGSAPTTTQVKIQVEVLNFPAVSQASDVTVQFLKGTTRIPALDGRTMWRAVR